MWEGTGAPRGNPWVHGECTSSTQTVPEVRIKPVFLVLWGSSSYQLCHCTALKLARQAEVGTLVWFINFGIYLYKLKYTLLLLSMVLHFNASDDWHSEAVMLIFVQEVWPERKIFLQLWDSLHNGKVCWLYLCCIPCGSRWPLRFHGLLLVWIPGWMFTKILFAHPIFFIFFFHVLPPVGKLFYRQSCTKLW